jgi:hypothetical protein
VFTLISCGANVHAVENNRGTALHFAAFLGHLEVARTLLNAGQVRNYLIVSVARLLILQIIKGIPKSPNYYRMLETTQARLGQRSRKL